MLKTLKQARTAFSLLLPDEIRGRASRPVTFGLVAGDDASFAEMADFLVPESAPPAVRAQSEGLIYRAGDPGVPDKVDLVLYEHGIQGPKGTYTFYRGDPERTVHEIVRENDDIAYALAQRFPAFRAPVVDRVIQSVARENALFAVTTALPDLIPNLGELPWAFGEFASDTAFLTANQVRMAFLIAAASGKPVGWSYQRPEIVAIAVGAFGWRAIARELAGKIPFGGGLIPKGAMAYAVTYGIGKGLERLYHVGRRYTRAERRDVYQDAYERGKSVAKGIAGAVFGR